MKPNSSQAVALAARNTGDFNLWRAAVAMAAAAKRGKYNS